MTKVRVFDVCDLGENITSEMLAFRYQLYAGMSDLYRFPQITFPIRVMEA